MVDSSDFSGYSSYTQVVPAGGSATVIWGTVDRGQSVDGSNKVEIVLPGQYVLSLIFIGKWVDSSGENYGQVVSYAGIIVKA